MLLPTKRKEPFCRIAGHTSEEVREILAALETVYHDPFPQLNLRQWSGAIYTWLTQPVLDPTRSGRVTMDYLMKLVTTALEWSHQAGENDVRVETLQAAAELLVLRRDTLRIIDGAGPSIEAPQSEPTVQSGTAAEHVSYPGDLPENATSAITERTEMVEQAPSAQNEYATSRDAVGDQKQPAKTTKCMFSGVVPIESKRFLDRGVSRVECPECATTRSLTSKGATIKFPSHPKRKTHTPNTEERWVRQGTAWTIFDKQAREKDGMR